MIIDLDAHQGNGHETDLGDDSMRNFFVLYLMILWFTGVWYVDNSFFFFGVQVVFTFWICTILRYTLT